MSTMLISLQLDSSKSYSVNFTIFLSLFFTIFSLCFTKYVYFNSFNLILSDFLLPVKEEEPSSLNLSSSDYTGDKLRLKTGLS